MGLSKLAEKCRACPERDTCNHKQMEAVAVISSPIDYGQNVLDCGTTVKLPDLDPNKYMKEVLDAAAKDLARQALVWN
jgi:hypothetical protein